MDDRLFEDFYVAEQNGNSDWYQVKRRSASHKDVVYGGCLKINAAKDLPVILDMILGRQLNPIEQAACYAMQPAPVIKNKGEKK